MKYDVVNGYREYLEKTYRPTTTRAYTNRLELLLKDQSVLNFDEQLDIDKMIQHLSEIKYKNEFSQSKNAFFRFLEFKHITLNQEQLSQIKQFEKSTQKKYRKKKSVNYKIVDKTIKHIRNQKLKLSYQTILNSGLRVFELSQIRRDDCIITNDFIRMYFTGKGGEEESVIILKAENELLYENLIELISNTAFTKKVFYSSNYLQKKAKEYNFCCHDLRRIYSKLEYKKTKSKKEVQTKMRHTNEKTTEIYLKSNIQM